MPLLNKMGDTAEQMGQKRKTNKKMKTDEPTIKTYTIRETNR